MTRDDVIRGVINGSASRFRRAEAGVQSTVENRPVFFDDPRSFLTCRMACQAGHIDNNGCRNWDNRPQASWQ
jgi:hypothetical protein